MRTKFGAVAALAAAASIALLPGVAGAHAERHVRFPGPPGSVPHYRTNGPSIVVCNRDSAPRISHFPPRLRLRNQRLLQRCRFHNIQAAVDHVRSQFTRILVLPGVYHEQPSLGPPPSGCEDFYRRARDKDDTDDVMSYREQRRCPHAGNLIAFFGDGPDKGIACDNRYCHLQIQGTGRGPGDVVIDARFRKLNVIRADRADGVYFRNFTVQHSTFNALYVIETDGYAIDRVVGRNNNEYGFLTFASDHGVYTHCEAYGNGDSGLYPGGQPDLHGARPAVEITHCRSHHNLLGYSGTAGNSTYVHDNRFFLNSVGLVTDSFVPNHPGMPQDSARFVHNLFFSNNKDFYRNYRNGTCDRPYREWGSFRWRGERIRNVCPTFQGPIGTGLLIAGGNQNLISLNHFWNNWRYGAYLFWVPAAVRGDDDPAHTYDTSHFNKYVRNLMGRTPNGRVRPNGLDFWWDEEGAGNCWQNNNDPRGISSDPPPALLPTCDQQPVFSPGDPAKTGQLGPCATWSKDNVDPPGCTWTHRPPRPR